MSSHNGSPVTGIIEEKEVILDFGKYEGKSIADIALLDQEFYNRLVCAREQGVFAIRRQPNKTFRLYLNPLSKMDH